MNLLAKQNDNATSPILYMALELSNSKWVIAFGNGTKTRKVSIDANDIDELLKEIQSRRIWFVTTIILLFLE